MAINQVCQAHAGAIPVRLFHGGAESRRAVSLSRIKGALPSYWIGQTARRSISSLAIKLFAISCSFLFAIIVARTFGARGYGIVAFALSVATVSSTFALLGTNGFAVRAVATMQARGDFRAICSFAKWSSRTVLVVSTLTGGLVALASSIGGPYRTALLIAALSIPLLALLNLQRGIAQGSGKVVAAQVPLDVVRWLITLVMLAITVAVGVVGSASIVLWIVLASLLVALLIALILMRASSMAAPYEPFAPHPEWTRESLPFLGIAFLGIVGTEINTLLLGVLAGPREAGLYQPIARLAPIMILAREALDMPLAPRIVQLWESRELEKLRRLLRRSAIACTLVTAVICTAVLLSSPLIFAAFGSEFEAYRSYLVWIAAAQIVNAAIGPAPILLSMVGEMKERVRAQVATVVVQFALASALVPTFGAAGAVVSLACAILVWSALHWLIALRSTGLNTSAFSS